MGATLQSKGRTYSQVDSDNGTEIDRGEIAQSRRAGNDLTQLELTNEMNVNAEQMMGSS